MAIGFSSKVFAKYFTEKIFKIPTEESGDNDVIVDEMGCSTFRENGILCEKCYNESLLKKMHTMHTNDKRVEFINHQLNLYKNPLQWLREMKDFLFEMDSDEGYLDYKEHQVYMQICTQGIDQIIKQDAVKQAAETLDIGLKLIWRKSPDLFYILFSSLYEEGFFNLKSGNNDEKAVAEILNRTFQVNAKIGERKEHAPNTFLQNFKGTSQLQTESKENIDLKNNVLAFLKSISDMQ